MTPLEVVSFRTEGLGDSTYLLIVDDLAVLVDPQRDVDRFLDALGGTDLRWVLETHVHNDYVSGALTAARRTGAELVLPAAAAPVFRHTPAFHHEPFGEGSLSILPLHTPGHTPEHTSYVVLVEGRERAVFSGGSLLVGSAGRSDLVGVDRADTLARLQHGSVRRLAELPDDTSLYPTHGAGSFCTVSRAGSHTSTIGDERRSNPSLAHEDEEAFVRSHLNNAEPYPIYYSRMAPINLAGPGPVPDLATPQVDPSDLDPSTTIVDTRSADAFAEGALPGSINIPMADSFGTWFGWLIPPHEQAVLVAESHKDVEEARLQLARIGIDSVVGAVIGPGPAATVRSGIADVSEVPDDAQLLDVRSPGERADRHDGSLHRYLPDLVHGPGTDLDPSQPVWVACASGFRATMGASLLRRQGFDPITVVGGGMDDLSH